MSATPTDLTKQISAAVSRRRVTDVVGRLHAQALDVTTAGELVALHCHTAKGTVVVTVAMPVFATAARGPRDGNGRPWPEPRRSSRDVLETDAERTRRAVVAQAVPEASPCSSTYTPPSPTGKITRAKMTPERLARIEAGARACIADASLRPRQVAEQIGEPLSTFYQVLGRLRRQTRQPVTKPNGRIL